MARWPEGTQQRLAEAAMALFTARGYEATTTADIAEAAGVTERTFYRYFADKREVLFGGSELLVEAVERGVAEAPEGAQPLALVAAALGEMAVFFADERKPWSRQRQVIIDASPDLQERELHKRQSLTTTMRAALRERGVGEPAASLAAQSGSSVFTLAFAQWLHEDESRTLAVIQTALLGELAGLMSGAQSFSTGA